MQIDELMALAELYAGSAVRQCEAIGSGRAYDDAYAQSMSDRASLRAAIESLIAASAAPAAPQQAEPVSYSVFDPSGEVVYAALFKTRCVEYVDNEYRYGHSAAKYWEVRPVFAHPPAAEVQRLREAAKRVIAAQSGSAFSVNESINELRRVLEGE